MVTSPLREIFAHHGGQAEQAGYRMGAGSCIVTGLRYLVSDGHRPPLQPTNQAGQLQSALAKCGSEISIYRSRAESLG